jgi:hypothetical protein
VEAVEVRAVEAVGEPVALEEGEEAGRVVLVGEVAEVQEVREAEVVDWFPHPP